MKKKLALLLAAVMVAAMVPVSAFASSQNRLVDNVKTVIKDTPTTSTIVIKDDKDDISLSNVGDDVIFEINLSNAKWSTAVAGDNGDGDDVADILVTTNGAATIFPTAVITVNSESSATIRVPQNATSPFVANEQLFVEFTTKVKADGEASITINPVSGGVSSGTYTYAIAASGSTTASVESSATIAESATSLKAISIIETAPGTLTGTGGSPGVITLKLSKNFKFSGATTGSMAVSYGDVTLSATPLTGVVSGSDDNTLTFTGIIGGTSSISKLVITGVNVEATSKAENGDVAEVTISGAGMSKQTLEVGTYAEYGFTLTVEDKDLPVLYAGSYDDNDTLKVTFKEAVANSWAANRKTTFTFPKGVKVNDVDVKKISNVNDGAAIPAAVNAAAFEALLIAGRDDNKITISGLGTSGKAEIQMVFELSVSPEYTGDITLAVGGSAVDEDQEVIVATAEMPFTVEVDVNEVNIDYRNVSVGDITIKEAYEGALEDGTTLTLQAENMSFEKGFTWEVTEGDLDVDDITIDGGNISIAIDSESAKTPGTIVISNLSLYLNRSLPAGNYALYVIGNTGSGAPVPAPSTTEAFFKNYAANDTDPYFDVDEVEIADAYVKVVTAGRDQDDSTFTTQIVVPIGAYEIKAGTKTVALDTPAYINEAGYTMMPLRGVVEALSGSAIISWDDATKTATILFGTRVISMTIGTKSMIINGTAIAMTSAPVIVNSRTFLPLRDLGYALGLSDNKIAWDDTTKTATLN